MGPAPCGPVLRLALTQPAARLTVYRAWRLVGTPFLRSIEVSRPISTRARCISAWTRRARTRTARPYPVGSMLLVTAEGNEVAVVYRKGGPCRASINILISSSWITCTFVARIAREFGLA